MWLEGLAKSLSPVNEETYLMQFRDVRASAGLRGRIYTEAERAALADDIGSMFFI